MRYLVALGDDGGEEKNKENNKMLVDTALKHCVPGRDCLLLARVIGEVKPDSIVLMDILYPLNYATLVQLLYIFIAY